MSFAILSLLLSHKLQYAFKGDKIESLEKQIEKVDEREERAESKKRAKLISK
jgi:hypothetical protein